MSNEKYDEIMENYWLVELARTNSNKLVACKNWYLTTSFNTSISEAMFKMEDAYPLAYDDETGEIAISMKTKANAMYSHPSRIISIVKFKDFAEPLEEEETKTNIRYS